MVKKGEICMKLFELLDIRPGVTALIGSGGKTSLLYHLAGELMRKGHKVVLTTTTHIRKPEQFPFARTAEEANAALATGDAVCVGTETEDGKLSAPDFDGWEKLAEYVLVEADGAKMLPLKAHAEHEPVIPNRCENVICVVGASGFDQPIQMAAHRPERYAELAGVSLATKVTPAIAAAVIRAEHLCTRVFFNQTDAMKGFFPGGQIKEFAKALDVPVVAGSLRQGSFRKY